MKISSFRILFSFLSLVVIVLSTNNENHQPQILSSSSSNFFVTDTLYKSINNAELPKQDGNFYPLLQQHVPGPFGKPSYITPTNRMLEEEETEEAGCEMCSRLGNTFLADKELDIIGQSDTIITCQTVQDAMSTFPPDIFPQPMSCRDHINNFELLCCDRTGLPMPYKCQEDTKSMVMGSGMYTSIPPVTEKGSVHVNIFLFFQSVTDLDIKSGAIEFNLALFMEWHDPRLAWNATSNISDDDVVNNENKQGCAQYIYASQKEIWVPDMDLVNFQTSLEESPSSLLKIYPDGIVQWQRQALLRGTCSFTGMQRIPYDDLGCTLLFSSKAYSDKIKIKFGGADGTGYGFGFEEFITRPFMEYRFIKEDTQSGYLPPTQDFIFYSLKFRRASRFYMMKIIIPSVLFAYLSFPVFFMDFESGERIGFGLNILLIMVAMDISTSDLLPICQESMWINVFVYSNIYWVMIGVLESLLVCIFYYNAVKRENEEKEMEERKSKKIDSDSDDEFQLDLSLFPTHESKSNEFASKIKTPRFLRIRLCCHKVFHRLTTQDIKTIDKVFGIVMPIMYSIYIVTISIINSTVFRDL
eukprot:CAMPEP_0184865458 /NCGR_PEP_ID=MMETSP0580-20130426/18199_1 /TAXON_ID=1118495 /ORGANISM="Dactyliosolen fragilissimus" /LENGTH=583 /DNA_ID=CAMNT_0027364677 /DNA_START=45 /DNA_END=1793 /DNA_ORIENTATION=-